MVKEGAGAAMLRYGAVTNATESAGAERLAVAGVELELVRRGTGRPVLLLHGAQTVDPRARYLELLGRHAEVIAPSHPGFGRSARPAGFETVYDLAHFYLDVLEALPQEKQRRSWHDSGTWAPDFNALSDDELVVRARNWEALCLYGWHPYMYNPQLKRWLRRITVPTLVLWGTSDGIVTPSYGRTYSELIPGSRFELIERAGHHPEIEQADAFVDAVAKFLNH